MKRPFAPLLHAGVIVALIVGTNDAAYWTVYTMSRLQSAAETVLRDLLHLAGAADAPSAALVGWSGGPRVEQRLQGEEGPLLSVDTAADPGVGRHAERALHDDVFGRGGQ